MSKYISHKCKQCGGLVIPKGHETSGDYNKRECCSRKCAGLRRSGGDKACVSAYRTQRAAKNSKSKKNSKPNLLAVALNGWRVAA